MPITTPQNDGGYVQAPDIYNPLPPQDFARNPGNLANLVSGYVNTVKGLNQAQQSSMDTQQQKQTLRGLVASTNAKNAADTEQNTKKLDLIDAQHDADLTQIKADQAKATQARIVNESDADTTQKIADNYNKGLPLFTGLSDTDKQRATSKIGNQLQQQALQAQAQQPGVSVANPNSPTGNPIPPPPPPQQGPLSGVGPSAPQQGAPAVPAGFGVGMGPGLPAYPAYRQSPLSGLAPTGSVGPAPANLANAQPPSTQPTAVANGPQNVGATGPAQVGPLTNVAPTQQAYTLSQALNSINPLYQAQLSQEQGKASQEQSRSSMLQTQAGELSRGESIRGTPTRFVPVYGTNFELNEATGETRKISDEPMQKSDAAQTKFNLGLQQQALQHGIDPAQFVDNESGDIDYGALKTALSAAIQKDPKPGDVIVKDGVKQQFNGKTFQQVKPPPGTGLVIPGATTGAAPAATPQQGTPASTQTTVGGAPNVLDANYWKAVQARLNGGQ